MAFLIFRCRIICGKKRNKMNTPAERVASFFAKMTSIVGHMESEPNKQKVEKMIDSIKYELGATPASTQTQYGGAYPGGLINYSIITTTILKKMSDATSKLPIDDVVIAGLFHHLGKMGYPDSPLYVPKNSDWHNKNGIMYEASKDYAGSGVNHNLTSLWYLSKYGIDVSPRAFEAISAINTKPSGHMDEFTNNELTILLLAASRLAWKKLTNENNG